ncbi:hypothetical protein GLOTRDRAFT_65249 [Gloeophyllum trabeum ATCC 11539]|uniref:CNH domain-containing protein n=1 Tax=Gloeophyllum trabeum (strain ATCC 11539 / FP-39264 / Madison 617) TaxID=670483 RepID=S7RDS9_GLOTA|nr:uncharacterized protein GLOTRDRAFT_65249 [Gloeophyllum trabeum ATCC 11539]EPQ52370.1 hypothetical protein GLOTRDRAFT_65249 [Gloeophyllum trabeum ATCC 11539]
MTSAPTNPLKVPPYQIQPLVASVLPGYDNPTEPTAEVRCAQALGSEIYIGCSNGELLRYALQADNPNTPESYQLLSRQSLPNARPIEEIALLPSISRALIFSDRQIHVYTLPSLDPVPPTVIKPIRNVVTLAVEDQHLKRSPPADPSHPVEAVEFCVIKRTSISCFSLSDRLLFLKDIPFHQGILIARRSGRYLCVLVADDKTYGIIDLHAASLVPLLPLSQAPSMGSSDPPVKPHILVVGDNEFLILSWTGASTIGVFITGEGDPVRGTLEWPSHPEAVCLDYPYITTLLSNGNIEIHSIETQAIVQVIPAPSTSPGPSPRSATFPVESAVRRNLVACANRYFVPSTKRSEKMKTTRVRLLRNTMIHENINLAVPADPARWRDSGIELPDEYDE